MFKYTAQSRRNNIFISIEVLHPENAGNVLVPAQDYTVS
jgi:hypothetical protein